MASGGAKDRRLAEKNVKHDEIERFYDRKVDFFCQGANGSTDKAATFR